MGLAGAGKTYTGNLIAEHLGFFAYDLDQDLIPEMRDAIQNRTAFTPEMRASYFKVISRRIAELKKEHPCLILMQAAYKEENRRSLVEEHPDVVFIHVAAPTPIILNRLLKRGDAISSDYAQTMAKGFEAPAMAPVLHNDTSDTEIIVARFLSLFEKESSLKK